MGKKHIKIVECSAKTIQRPIVMRRSRYLAEHTKRRSLTGAAAGREENWVTVARRNGIAGESLHVGGVTCY